MLRRREHISDLILRSRASLRGVSKDEVVGLEYEFALLVIAIRHQAPSAAFATASAVIWPSNAALAPRRIVSCARSDGDGRCRAAEREFYLPRCQDELDRVSQPSRGRRAAAGGGDD